MARSLTNNYQRLLKQATKEIKKLNVEKWKVEQEQDKLLTTNLELAEEVRRMMESDKAWRAEKQTLLNVNDEFATEVERLYKNEEKYMKEKDRLESQLKDLERRYESERQNQSSHLHDEQSKLETQIKKLTQSLGTMKEEYQQLLDSNKRKENQLSDKQEVSICNIIEYVSESNIPSFPEHYDNSREGPEQASRQPQRGQGGA